MSFYANSKAPGVPVYATASLFPPVSYQGALAEAADTNTLYSFDNGTWVVIASPGGFSGVSSLNALTGALTLVGGTDISITPSGSTIIIASTATPGANTALSNLTNPTAINQDLLPGVDLSINIGSTSKRFLGAHISDVVVANIDAQGTGDLTIATSGAGSVLFLAPNNVVDFSNKPTRNMSVLGLNASGFDFFLRQATTPSSSYTLRVPPAQGAASQTLVNDGSGNLSWATPTSGTVTSVALTVPSFLSVSGSPITSSGTLAVTLVNESANTVFAGPASGGPAAPTFRALVTADLPAGTGTVTNVATGTGLTGGPITTTGTISLANTAVTPGSYTNASITVDQQGRLTSASSGAPTPVDAYVNGGNAFGGNATLGLTDNFNLSLITNNVIAQTINADGTIEIPGNTSVGTTPDPDIKLSADNSRVDQGLTAALGFNASSQSTVSGAHSTYGIIGQIEVAVDSGINNTIASSALLAVGRRGNTTADAGTLKSLIGNSASISQEGVNSTAVTQTAAAFVASSIVDSGTVDNMYDILVKSSSITGATVTNRFGLFINDDDIGVKNNFLAGRTVLGGTYSTPSSVLEVAGDIKMKGATSGFVAMQSPAAPTSYTLTFPNDAGTSGYVLSTDGTGILSWIPAGTTPTGDPNTMAFFDGSGNLADQTNFTFDGSTLVIPGDIIPGVTDSTNVGNSGTEFAGMYANTYYGINDVNLYALNGDANINGLNAVTLLANNTDVTITSSLANINLDAAAGAISLNTTTGPVTLQGDTVVITNSAATSQVSFAGAVVTPTASVLTLVGALNPSTVNGFDVGTANNTWNSMRARRFIAYDAESTDTARATLEGTAGQTAQNGTAVGAVLRTNVVGDNFEITTANANPGATASGSLILQTGNRTTAATNSGNILLQPGIASGAGSTQGLINTRSNFFNLRNNAATVGASTGNAQELRFFGATNDTNYIGLKAGSLSGNTSFTLPLADGSSGQFLQTDGSGHLSFATPSDTGITELTGDVTAGPGSGSQAATIAKLQGNTVSASSPSSGQVLEFNGTAWVPATLPASPAFVKYTKSFSDFSTAGNTNSITLFSLPAATIVEQIVIRQTASFTGGAISAYTVSVGVSGNNAKYASAFDVFQAPGSAIGELSTSPGFEDFASPVTITVTAISTGDTLNNASAGSVDIYVLTRSIL